MMDLDELYQEVILDHKRHPRNFHAMESATREVDGHNPLCGDHLHLYLRLAEDRIDDISFLGQGCAISTASASLMTERLKGHSVEEAMELFDLVHRVLTEAEPGVDMNSLGKLQVFAGVRNYPSRVKCASLAWHTLRAALQQQDCTSISTE